MDTARDADALIVLTEWKNYKSPNLRALKDALRHPLVLDGRNIYEPQAMAAAGLAYLGIGRNNLALLPEDQQVLPAQAILVAQPAEEAALAELSALAEEAAANTRKLGDAGA